MKGEKTMKNRTSKILVLALVIATMLCATFAMIVSANATETKPEIISKNMLYSDKYSIMYAVAAESVAQAPVTLNVYREYPTATSTPVGEYVANAPQNELIGGVTRSVYVFKGFGIGAQDFADKIYAQAIDKAGNKSEVVEYSVVEYFLERLYGGYDLNAKQVELYNAGLTFGTAAQNMYAEDDAIKINDYKYVRVEGGTVNGVTKGMFLKGTALTIVKDVPADALLWGWNVTENGETRTEASLDNYALVNSMVVEADYTVGGSLGYYATVGGQNFDSLANVYRGLEAYVSGGGRGNIIIERRSNTPMDCDKDVTNHTTSQLSLFNNDGNKVLMLCSPTTKSAPNGAPGFVGYIPSKLNADYYVFESDIILGNNLSNGASALSIGFIYF